VRAGLLLAGAVAVLALGSGVGSSARERGALDPASIRAIVAEKGETEPATARALRVLGANALVTHANPNDATARIAAAEGLAYIARMSTQDAARAATDLAYAQELRSVEGVSGVYYEDDEAEEGYASPAAQEATYRTLKALFPGALILHPTRLDPIARDPAYLDGFFRPAFTDLVTPYFYPVGTTVLGTFREEDAWEPLLETLLRPIAARMPPGKGVFPVLQGFEQIGFPLDSRFPRRQMDVYARVWPGNASAVIFAWRIGVPQPLIDLADRPQLQRGVCDLFSASAPFARRCRWTASLAR